MRVALKYLLLQMFLLAWINGLGQEFVPSRETTGMRVAADLNGVWVDEENHFRYVPFMDSTGAELVVTRSFTLKPAEREGTAPLYFYFEGVAWNAEVYLNGKLLDILEDPFKTRLIALERNWLKPEGNEIRMNISASGKSQIYYPARFTGIFRPAWVLTADGTGPVAPVYQQALESKKVALIAPWSDVNGAVVTPAEMEPLLKAVGATGEKNIAFAFPPPMEVLRLAGTMGFTVIAHPEYCSQLGLVNYWPCHRGNIPHAMAFWLVRGQRTPAYGRFFSRDFLQDPQLNQPNHLALFIFMAIPIVCLALIRLLSDRIYSSLPQFITKPRIFLEQFTNNKMLGQWEAQLINFFRLLIGAVVLSLILYYITLNHHYQRLNILSDESVLFQFLTRGDYSLYALYAFSLAFLVLVNVLRHFTLSFLGGIFGEFGLNQALLGLDLFASYPTNFLPLIPALMLFFTQGAMHTFTLVLLAAFLALYAFRRIAMLLYGFNSVVKVSLTGKILYICAFEILPWIVLV